MTLLFLWLWVCARLGFCSTGSWQRRDICFANGSETKANRQERVAAAYADDCKDSAVAMLTYRTSIPYLVEPVLPVRRRQMLQKLYRERWKVQTILHD